MLRLDRNVEIGQKCQDWTEMRTFCDEPVSAGVDLEIYTSPPLRVVDAAQLRCVLLTSLVHVHITGWK